MKEDFIINNMTQKTIAHGAEAIIFQDNEKIIKKRIAKGYRLPILDGKIRKQRTKRESSLLEKSGKITNIPKVLKTDKFNIEMEFINGEKLSRTLDSYDKKKQLEVMKKLGKQIAKLHENNIIHGDLTTSNLILKKDKLYIIDFGLGFISQRIEDKAVDLHLIKQALEAKHFQNWRELYNAFLEAYQFKDSKKVLEQLVKVELRGRYKH